MSSYWGSFHSKLDSKGRINFPAKLRKNLQEEDQETLVLVRGNAGCVSAYPTSSWQEKIHSIRAQVPNDRQFAMLSRQLMYQASEQTIDKQGRLNLTAELIKFAEIDGEVLVVGSENKIEIWNRRKFDQVMKATEVDFLKIASDLDI